MEEFVIMRRFTGSHQISGGKLKTASQGAFIKSIVLLNGSYFLISKNLFSDIIKYKSFFISKIIFRYKEFEFVISKNDFSDIRKRFVDIKN